MMVAGVGAVFAWFGLREFKQMRGDKLPWVAIIYPSVIPMLPRRNPDLHLGGARMAERACASTPGHECAAIDGSCLRKLRTI